MAAQNLLRYSGSALAGGVNLMLAEHTTAAAAVAGMLTADGRCKTMDASADGYVRAEACIVLRLDAAASTTDGTQAVILAGSFVNQVRIAVLFHTTTAASIPLCSNNTIMPLGVVVVEVG